MTGTVCFSLNLFGNLRFWIGYLEMRCSKSCYVYDLELVDLFENAIIEQVYCLPVSLSYRLNSSAAHSLSVICKIRNAKDIAQKVKPEFLAFSFFVALAFPALNEFLCCFLLFCLRHVVCTACPRFIIFIQLSIIALKLGNC